MRYDPTFFDGLYKCNLRLLRSLCGALGISYQIQTPKVRLISDIISVLNIND